MSKNKRSLYFLFFATFFIFVNFFFTQSVTPLYILDVGGTEFYSGIQGTLFCVSAVILRFYLGPLADRKGKKINLLIGGTAFLTAPLLFLLSRSVWYIILVRMFQAVGLAAYFATAPALVSALAPKKELGTYIGIYRMVSMLPLLGGPSLAFVVIEKYGYPAYHAMGIIVGLFAMIFLIFVNEPDKEERGDKLRKDLQTINMLKLLKEKSLKSIYFYTFFISIFFGFVQTFTAIYIRQYVQTINPGIFFALFGIGSLLANLIAGHTSDRKGRRAAVFPCMLVAGIGMVVLYFLPVADFTLYIGSIFTGFGLAGCTTVLIAWVIDRAPQGKRTTALALQGNSEDIGIALGAFLSGILITMTDISEIYRFGGYILLLFGIVNIISSRWKKRYRMHEEKENDSFI